MSHLPLWYMGQLGDEMCDRIMVIEGGRMVAFDRPDVLRAKSEF